MSEWRNSRSNFNMSLIWFQYLNLGNFILPTHGVFESDSVRPETLESVFEELHDAVSLVFMGRLENRQEMSTSVTERLHSTMQKLFYFLNVDGSFGEPLVIESFRWGCNKMQMSFSHGSLNFWISEKRNNVSPLKVNLSETEKVLKNYFTLQTFIF